MKEAVEIAKLRLFLKLVAEVDPSRHKKKENYGLEPLPDIDFNIRSGNTLVGFATERQLEEVIKNTDGDLIYEERLQELKASCETTAASFDHFKKMQMIISSDSAVIRDAKQSYANSIVELNKRLNRYLADTYGLGTKTQWKSQKEKDQAYENWKESHQPFHWFAEFYEIISKGGFDVVIGNPPYVEMKKASYQISNYSTISCGNLYASVVERTFSLIAKNGKTGMIIPHSSICTDRMNPLQNIFKNKGLWLSSFDIRPAKLFDGVDQRLLIYIADLNSGQISTSSYHRWYIESREFLFSVLKYIERPIDIVPNSIAKASRKIEIDILKKIKIQTILKEQYGESHPIYYHNAPRYFIRAMKTPPFFWNEKHGEKLSIHIKSLGFRNVDTSKIVGAVLNSNLFYLWFILFSNCRDFINREIDCFPLSLNSLVKQNTDMLCILFDKLNKDFNKNKRRKEAYYQATGKVIYDEFYPKLSKPIIDEIDKVLAKHYGFTEEELDFIINYDIKYRMGDELDGKE
jgi:hypothetical protein